MKKIAALLVMSAMAGQVFAADAVVTTGAAAGETAAVNALGLTTLSTVGIVAGVTALAVVAADNGGSTSSTTTSSN